MLGGAPWVRRMLGGGDRRFLCGPIRSPAISLVLQDGLQGVVGMGADGERVIYCRFKLSCRVSLG